MEVWCHLTGGNTEAGKESWPGGLPACCSHLCSVSGAVSYTVLYNCLDFPAGVVPVTTVTAEDEAQMEHYRGYFGDMWDKVLQKVRSWGLAYPLPGPPSLWTQACTLALAAMRATA